ncbi:MAG: hypothetical protein K2Q26_13440 [Bdellovibrionales bacterium]|nr:hypothetical protein [Bdellovibrionales bacterium]
MMKSFFKRRKSNQKGAILLLTVVIISLVLITIAAVSSYKLTALAKQSARLNEALAYLTVMEEMGQVVAEAYYEAVPPSTCLGGKTSFPIGGISLCSPNGAANGICITKEHGGVNRTFCLQPGAPGAELVTRYTPETQPHLFFDVAEKKEWSLANYVWEKLSLAKSFADYPDFPPWTPASDPWRGNVPHAGGGADTQITETPAVNIAGLPATPGGAGQQATSGAYGGGSGEPWVPTPAWAASNEIFIPSCTADSQQRLGCMKCNVTGVRCIQFRLCLSGGGGCDNPLVQRIAIY